MSCLVSSEKLFEPCFALTAAPLNLRPESKDWVGPVDKVFKETEMLPYNMMVLHFCEVESFSLHVLAIAAKFLKLYSLFELSWWIQKALIK